MSDYKIEREDSADRGRYVIDLAVGVEAEMTYKKADGRIIVDHTGVPKEYEGRGIALQLVKAAIADARAEGFKITPVCPYVVVQFDRHPDWADLRA